MRRFFAAALVILAATDALADASAGSTGGQVLEIGTGARSSARGDAEVAWAESVYGVFYNPAGIAGAARPEMGVLYHGLHGDMGYSFLGAMQPLGRGRSMALTVSYLDYGTIQRTTITSGLSNVVTGEASAQSGVFTAAYAAPIGERIDVGVGLKGVSERFDRHSASAFAIDLGAILRAPVDGLTAGISIANIGTDFGYVRRDEELPLTGRLGGGFRSADDRWGIAADVVWVKSQSVEGKAGGEYWVWPGRFVLRSGINTASQVGSGLTFGLGLTFSSIALDYSFIPATEIGSTHNVSLTYQFLSREVNAPVPKAPAAVDGRNVLKRELDRIESGRDRIFVEPFRMMQGPAKQEFLGAAIRDIFTARWSERELLAEDIESARFLLVGEYWIDEEIDEIVVRAKIMSGIRLVTALEWRSIMSGRGIDDLWTRMMEETDAALRDAIRRGGTLS